MAGAGGTRQGGVLRPGASPWGVGRVRFLSSLRVGGDDRRAVVRPSPLSLRAHLLQLGDGSDLLLGELRELVGRVAGCAVGTGRGAPAPPHGLPDGGRAALGRNGRVYPALPSVARPLWLGGGTHPTRPGARERRRGATALSLSHGPRSGADAARQPRRCGRRCRGRRVQEQHRTSSRHVIAWLIRKPGAFANYRYQSALFPTSRFR